MNMVKVTEPILQFYNYKIIKFNKYVDITYRISLKQNCLMNVIISKSKTWLF